MPIVDKWLYGATQNYIPATVFKTFRVPFDDDGNEGEPYEMPNVQFIRATRTVGGDASQAEFHYIFGLGNPAAPDNPEEALNSLVVLPLTVDIDDKLIAVAVKPFPLEDEESPYEFLFVGRVLNFALQQEGRSETVAMLAHGVERQLRDTPLGGAIYRNSDKITTVKGEDVLTGSVAHFNPKGVANRTPDAYPSNPKDNAKRAYHVFLDPGFLSTINPALNPKNWLLPDSVEHALYTGNPDEKDVVNMDKADLDKALVSYEPKTTDGLVDFDDPTSYTTKPITTPDMPIDTQDLVGVVKRLVNDKGFSVRFPLTTDEDTGLPITTFDIYIPQAQEAVDIWLQPRGTALDTFLSNFAGGNVGRDLSEAVNEWIVLGREFEIEFTAILAPNFPIAAADALNPETYNLTSPTYTTSAFRKYREWVMDEAGMGHYPNDVAGSQSFTPPSLDLILGAPIAGKPQYARRLRRPVSPNLFSVDSFGKALKISLDYSTDTRLGSTPIPRVFKSDVDQFQPTPNIIWTPVVHGWEPLKDRIGFRCNAANPNNWAIGDAPNSTAKTVLRLVEAMAAPDPSWNPPVFFRYTVCIYADKATAGIAGPLSNAALKRKITRFEDARDRYRRQVRYRFSKYSASTAADVVFRDDTDAATSEAKALQLATSGGVLSGDITIPYFTNSFKEGMRLRQVNGRDVSFRTDDGNEEDPPILPSICSVTIDAIGQSVHLNVSDASTVRPHYRSRGRRR